MSGARRERSDPTRVVITPEGIAMPVRLASRGSRFGALLLDLLLMVVATVIITIVLSYTAAGLDKALGGKLGTTKPEFSPAIQFVIVVYIAALFLLRYGYFMMFELGPRGATPGKRMVGIRIAARSGGRLNTEMVVARNLLRDVEILLPLGALFTLGFADGIGKWPMAGWLLVFALFPFFNRDRLRAGDLIAGTWVIEAPRAKLEAALSTTRTATSGTSGATGASYKFSDEELAVYGEYELQTLERVLRDNRTEALIAVHEAICRKIGWNPGAGDEHAFLEAYYTQLRHRLESGMRMGRRKANKFSG